MFPHNSAWNGIGVKVRVFQEAGEATATLGWKGQDTRPPAAGPEGRVAPPAATDGPELDAAPPPTERTDHDRRAVGRIRRYATQNGIRRLATLTLGAGAGLEDLRGVVRLAQGFQRRLREAYPAVSWVRVFERHESGDLHLHYGLSDFVPQPHLQAMWLHGIVDVRLIRARRGRRGRRDTRPGREACRRAGRYLSKYVVKDPVRVANGHRYEVRQGFQPGADVVWVDGDDPTRAMAMVADSLGLDLAYTWSSSGSPEWDGPPMTFASW